MRRGKCEENLWETVETVNYFYCVRDVLLVLIIFV